ncbi:MAG TPA: thiamine pyrophosphate-binding protein [Vicinamibacterales bacterium]|nr:thiamine pyrophosphate-binding protein [Vicinamibacterales bacterium]
MSTPTCAAVLARTLREAGITRMFGLPGGEVLDFIDAARREGIDFLLTRHEAGAAFMADVTGQIQRRPGVCVATLGPGAMNMALGVANAYLDRSPVIAITATLARANSRIATHQDLDLNAVYRPFTKLALTLDGHDTAAKVRHAIAVSLEPRMGPVHIAVPSDVARTPDADTPAAPIAERSFTPAPPADLDRVATEIARARRPVVVLGIDVNPHAEARAVRAFVDALGAPVFVTPKAKGLVSEDHPLFYGVCAGVSADAVVVDWLGRADLLIGVGFDPVESDKVWHHTMPMVSVGPVSIAKDDFRPRAEAVGDLSTALAVLATRLGARAIEWTAGDRATFRRELEAVLRPTAVPRGLSGYELTRRLRESFPRDTIFVTDVGSVKMVTSQAWTSYEPQTFFESNGLSAMSYSLPAAMAARLQYPKRPILCTIGDGGFGMTIAEIETCVRERLHFTTVVYNDSSLSLIDAAQQRRGYPTTGVRHSQVDFAAAAAAFGAWSRRVETMEQLDAALGQSAGIDRPVVIDAVVDPAEYRAQTGPRGKLKT